jgi:hypothetical protein
MRDDKQEAMRMTLGHWCGAPHGGVLQGTLRTQMTIQTSK